MMNEGSCAENRWKNEKEKEEKGRVVRKKEGKRGMKKTEGKKRRDGRRKRKSPSR